MRTLRSDPGSTYKKIKLTVTGVLTMAKYLVVVTRTSASMVQTQCVIIACPLNHMIRDIIQNIALSTYPTTRIFANLRPTHLRIHRLLQISHRSIHFSSRSKFLVQLEVTPIGQQGSVRHANHLLSLYRVSHSVWWTIWRSHRGI